MLIVALTVFLGGLGFARLAFCLLIIFCASVFFLAFGFLLRTRKPKVFYILFIIFAFVAGWMQGTIHMQKLAAYQTTFGQAVVLEVTAREDSYYNDKSQMEFSASNVVQTEPAQTKLPGQIIVNGRGVPMVYRGDRLKISGKLFPRRGANQAGMGFANIELLARSPTKLDTFRRNFAASMQNVLPEPLASFGLGLLIGQRTSLGSAVNDQLTNVGLIHIVAVSGYNLTVIVMIVRRLFEKRSRYQAFIISSVLIGLFLLITGGSPSIVRAAVVSGVSLVLWYFGRKIRGVLILMISAALTAGVNPLYIWGNIGWYLSFTAFFGVLVLAPLLLVRFKKAWRENMLIQVLAETTAAQLCTLPIILFIFGRLSVVSIIANLLVVPLVPLAMFFSLVAGLASLFHAPLLFLLALPARLLLRYMIDISSLLARVPYANVEFQISSWQMIALYILILLLTIILWFKNKNGTITGKKT